jgi:hypothetical protein
MHLELKRGKEANLASDLIFFRPCVKKTKTAELPEEKKEVISLSPERFPRLLLSIPIESKAENR